MKEGIIQTNFLLIMGQSTPTQNQTESETGGSTAKLTEHFADHDNRSTDWLQLDDQEEVLWIGSPTPRRLVVPFGLVMLCLCSGLVTMAVGIFELFGDFPSSLRWVVVAAGVLLITVALVLAFLFYRSHQQIQYAITTNGLYRKWSSSKITQIEIEDIAGSTYYQSWLDRQFSCGEVHITSPKTGAKRLFYSAVPNPRYVRTIVMDSMAEER